MHMNVDLDGYRWRNDSANLCRRILNWIGFKILYIMNGFKKFVELVEMKEQCAFKITLCFRTWICLKNTLKVKPLNSKNWKV